MTDFKRESDYDSTADTERHINEVRELLLKVIREFTKRAIDHDYSKLEPPEKAAFDLYTPQLEATTYDTPEYHAAIEGMGPALAHHYELHRHHPEHFLTGIKGMTLIDLIEMLCDWKAATLRHRDGDMRTSIEKNQMRFGYTDEMRDLLMNTARYLGML